MAALLIYDIARMGYALSGWRVFIGIGSLSRRKIFYIGGTGVPPIPPPTCKQICVYLAARKGPISPWGVGLIPLGTRSLGGVGGEALPLYNKKDYRRRPQGGETDLYPQACKAFATVLHIDKSCPNRVQSQHNPYRRKPDSDDGKSKRMRRVLETGVR